MKTVVLIGVILLLSPINQATAEDEVPDFPVHAMNQQLLTKGSDLRIINGEDAAPGQFPYQVGLYLNYRGFCGGALITTEWVLTAAHCIQIKNYMYTVFLGAREINLPTEPGRTVFNTRTAIKHEKYNAKTVANDVGVIKLPEPVSLSAQINTISLPPRSHGNQDFAGAAVRVSGWGQLSDSSTLISEKLQFVDLTVITNAECAKSYGKNITETVVCANGADKKNTCNDDGGGPLVFKEKTADNKTTHFGIVSFVSSKGCASGNPSGYVRTAKYLDWINAKTGIPIQD